MIDEEITLPLAEWKAKVAHIARLERVLRLVTEAEDYDTIEAAKQAARDALGLSPVQAEGANDADS